MKEAVTSVAEDNVCGADVKEAMLVKDVKFLPVRRCGICRRTKGFVISDGQVFQQDSCDCAEEEPVQRTFDHIADEINQARPLKYKMLLKVLAGFEVIMNEEPEREYQNIWAHDINKTDDLPAE